MQIVKDLIEKEEGPNPAARLAVKLGVSESYIRMLAEDKASPGWRLSRDINLLYKEDETDGV